MSFPPTEDNQDHVSSNDLRFDNSAFEAFFKENFVPLCSYCQYKYGVELNQAKEIVHTSFIKLWEVRHTLEGSSVKGYMYRIIINTCLDLFKHEKVRQQHVEFVQKTASIETSPNSFESIDYKQLSADINKALTELPQQMRQVFELSRFEGLKYVEIAAHLNISVKTVETQMSRALAKLRQKLSGYLATYLILFILSVLEKKYLFYVGVNLSSFVLIVSNG